MRAQDGPAARRAEPDTDVLVVGAGPVGLLLACELRRYAVSVLVVERLATAMTESRASQLSTRTAELLHDAGFDDLLGEAAREPRGHFGGLPIDLTGLPGRYPGNWKVPQYRTEAVFRARAERSGAAVRPGHELTGLSQGAIGVRGRVAGRGGPVRITARYVVGCDGTASTVRRLAGFRVSTSPATRELLRADVTGLRIRDRRFERLPDGFAVASTRDGVTRVMVHSPAAAVVRRCRAPQFAEVVRTWQRVTGEDISAGTPIWLDSFDNARGLVTGYRIGRVLLAGDAAHWHPPIGGQALNVGLHDAVDLGWKLAAAVHGTAPPDVLDSYAAERHAVAAAVLRSVAAQEELLLGGPEVEPLRSVLAEVLELPPVANHLARVVAGVDHRFGVPTPPDRRPDPPAAARATAEPPQSHTPNGVRNRAPRPNRAG